LPMPKIVRIRRGQDYYPTIVGLHILRLVKHGYKKFEVVEYNEEELVIKALRRKKKGEAA